MPPRKRPRQQRPSRTSRRSPSPTTTNASLRPLYEARTFFDECSICLCDFESASDCAFYPCRHFVHHACHVTWMSNQRPVADSNASAPSTDNPIQYPPGHHIPADFVRRHDECNLLHAQRELVAEPLPDPLKDALLTALRNGQVLHEEALAVIRGMSNVLTRLPYLLNRWLDANGVSIQQRYAEFRVHCSICQQPYHPIQIASVPYSEIVMPSREPEPEPESQQEQDAEDEDGGGDDRDDDAGRSASSASASSAPYATRSSSSSSTSTFSSSSRKEIEVIVISSDDEDDDYDRGRDRDDDDHHHNNDDSDDSDDDERSSSSHHPFVVHGHHRRRVEPDEIIVIND